ncbi:MULTISPECIES: nitrilase-related carbon-nitrogen hydrolase [Actinomadura]|uniref:Nitrilase-related carbon-nitrogen hydrolase n=1 Tax=Actinomadura yumaensis TaxID=111807 RepID=A0ABW2CEP3_9ACTN|nr:nitrilase-related carbon-nitrogen hydrolase [Actinomadura sp. J1-007]MWK38363.1 nitrilase [Actinomadura sp. J1-007]
MTDDASPAYRALALQSETRAVNGLPPEDARAAMMTAIGRVRAQVTAARGWVGPDLRLVVLPEYFLTGFPMGESVALWRETAALAPDGPEYEALAAIAADLGIFLSGNAYESDPHFPALYFQSSFIIDPRGETVLRYRRLHSMYSPSPYDVWDAYLDVYGIDGVLPVARTELGMLACVASEEILYPELARVLALRGAEVFCHSTSEASSPALLPKEIARRARATENLAYVVSANSGGLDGIAIPRDSTSGGSKVVDFEGRVLAEAAQGESVVATAELDLAALRRHRARPGMGNLLSRTKPALWAEEYARHEVERPNGLDGVVPDRAWFVRRQRDSLARLREAGVIR